MQIVIEEPRQPYSVRSLRGRVPRPSQSEPAVEQEDPARQSAMPDLGRPRNPLLTRLVLR